MRRTPCAFSTVVSGPRRPWPFTWYSTSARARPAGRSSNSSLGFWLRRTVSRLICTVPTLTPASRKTISSTASITTTLASESASEAASRRPPRTIASLLKRRILTKAPG